MDQTQPHPPETPGPLEGTASVRSIVVQVAAYAGVAMGLVGTLALVASTAEPSDTTLLLTAIAVTAVLFAAGVAIGRHSVSSNQRLRSVLWFAALLGWGIVVEAFLVVAEVDLAGRSRQLISAVLVAVVAVGLWIGLRRTLQLIGMFSSLFAVLSAAVFPQPDPFGQPDLLAPAVLSWVFGAAWMALGARGVIQPPRPALVLGTITVLVAPVILVVQGIPSESTLTAVELWVLAGGVACLSVGTWLADGAVQGLAIFGVLAGVAVLAGDRLAGSRGGSIAAVALGIALLAGAVIAIRVWRPATAAAPPAPPAPPAPAAP